MQARLWIDLSVDLREDFTWLTKQLFLFVTVDFETPENRLNQMVMWSHIIEKKVRRGGASCIRLCTRFDRILQLLPLLSTSPSLVCVLFSPEIN